MLKEPTPKRRLFVEFYLGVANGNASKAARMAGYADPNTGIRLLRRPEIRALIESRVSAAAMATDKALSLLSQQAEGSMGDFVTFDTAGKPHIDLKKAEARGKLHLVRKLRRSADGAIEIELYSAQTALARLVRYFMLFKAEAADTEPVEIVYVNDWRPKDEP
jgi:hypothetical protein